MNNKEVKEEPWKRRKKGRGKKGMNNKEGREEPWKRGKKGMNNEEGKEEPWKRGKAKLEQAKTVTKEAEKEQHLENQSQKIGEPALLASCFFL